MSTHDYFQQSLGNRNLAGNSRSMIGQRRPFDFGFGIFGGGYVDDEEEDVKHINDYSNIADTHNHQRISTLA